MQRPTPFGWFHILCLILVLISIIILYKKKNFNSEKRLKKILFIYGFVALILEILKQIIWSYKIDPVNGIISVDYQWYAFPFQLCTTPIFISLICSFMKKNKIRDNMLSYMAYITILGSISTMIVPESCFVETILVNIHTMWLHLGSFVVSIYLIMSSKVKQDFKSFKGAVKVFIIFLLIAQTMNIIIYNSGILNGETFNMFYISPYFISSLPIFDMIQKSVPFIIYLIVYVVTLITGGFIIFLISKFIKKIIK